uniref:Uncharacterized protein n=1 Tax=Rhizophora mucronata TaxID=61149 RepID=A0A2P2PCR1_RHIMU
MEPVLPIVLPIDLCGLHVLSVDVTF